jgi:hypothetical protein
MPKLRERMMQNADEEDDDGNDGEEGPPRKITRNVGGQKRKYIYVKSVKSMAKVDKFRFKVIGKIKVKNNLMQILIEFLHTQWKLQATMD